MLDPWWNSKNFMNFHKWKFIGMGQYFILQNPSDFEIIKWEIHLFRGKEIKKFLKFLIFTDF